MPSAEFRGAQAVSGDVAFVKGHEFGLYDLRKTFAILLRDVLHCVAPDVLYSCCSTEAAADHLGDNIVQEFPVSHTEGIWLPQ